MNTQTKQISWQDKLRLPSAQTAVAAALLVAVILFGYLALLDTLAYRSYLDNFQGPKWLLFASIYGFLIAAHWLLSKSKVNLPRVLFLSLVTFVIIRYLVWRISSTLSLDLSWQCLLSLVLFAAELYGIVMFIFSVVVNIKPIKRHQVGLYGPEKKWPSVDVFITTFNEDQDLIKTTLLAATSINYPKNKLKIYLLDDGASVEKRYYTNTTTSQQAWDRYRDLKLLCQELGTHYLTRKDNSSAKAGNLNAAFQQTSGDLILVLDTDHVPTVDILEKTVGYFVQNEKLFLAQTPHFFVTPDPVEKNLKTFEKMPSENQMFYEGVQLGLDFWNSSFFCGSAAVLRRKALYETSGFSGQSITEDAETALTLHQKGWDSCYLSQPLTSGLHPDTFSSFVTQRVRWAQGMTQLFLFKNPLFASGLRPMQRLCYLSGMMFWFFPLPRIIFLVAPAFYLLFGIRAYNANIDEVLLFTIPYILCLVLTSNYLFSKVRWILVSEIYETMQSLFSLVGIYNVLRSPTAPTFIVTPKQELLDDDFISPLAKPFYLFGLLSLVTLAAGIYKLINHNDEIEYIAATLVWAALNAILVWSAFGALLERKQRRKKPRMPVTISAALHFQTKTLKTTITDISTTGGNIQFNIPEKQTDSESGQAKTNKLPSVGTTCTIEVNEQICNGKQVLQCKIVNIYSGPNNTTNIGIRFTSEDIGELRAIVLLAHGSSDNWSKTLDRQDYSKGIIRDLWFVLKAGLSQGLSHLFFGLNNMTQRITSKTTPGTE